MALTRTWIPYLWAAPAGGLGWCATHDKMVRHMGLPEADPWAGFLAILAGYCLTLVACHRKPASVHQLGHLVAFEAAVVWGFCGAHLQCVAGIMYVYLVAGMAGVVVLGAVVLAVTRRVVWPGGVPNGQG